MSQCLEPGKQWRLNNSKIFLIFIFIIFTIIRASLVVQTVKNLPAMQETRSIPGSGGSAGEGNGNPLQYSCLENLMERGAGRLQSMGWQRVGHDWATQLNSGFPGGAIVKSLPANARDAGLTCGSGRSPGVGNDNPLLYSCLENSIDRGAWCATYSP